MWSPALPSVSCGTSTCPISPCCCRRRFDFPFLNVLVMIQLPSLQLLFLHLSSLLSSSCFNFHYMLHFFLSVSCIFVWFLVTLLVKSQLTPTQQRAPLCPEKATLSSVRSFSYFLTFSPSEWGVADENLLLFDVASKDLCLLKLKMFRHVRSFCSHLELQTYWGMWCYLKISEKNVIKIPQTVIICFNIVFSFNIMMHKFLHKSTILGNMLLLNFLWLLACNLFSTSTKKTFKFVYCGRAQS